MLIPSSVDTGTVQPPLGCILRSLTARYRRLRPHGNRWSEMLGAVRELKGQLCCFRSTRTCACGGSHMLRRCFLILALTVAATSAMAQTVTPSYEIECAAVSADGAYWIECEAACPDKTTPISGACWAGDTRGSAIALESFGVVGSAWRCRYVDTRTIGTGGGKLNPDLKVRSTAYCLK
jgi:hypothetical protein